MLYYKIILPVPSSDFYTYQSDDDITVGSRVKVNFNNKERVGIVFSKTEKPEFDCKDIISSLDDEPLFSEQYLNFITALGDYYLTSYGLVLFGILSEILLSIEKANEYKKDIIGVEAIELTDDQIEAVNKVQLNKFFPALLHGVTGSGKTEVYLEVAKKVIANKKQVLYIVPEISLTPQLIDRIGKRLGIQPSSFHSRETDSKRKTSFLSFAKSEIEFIIGARSALFLPSKNLGLIIVDEEHEPSYKQDEAPSYHLRDMAVLYAKMLDIPIIMGSATVSVESYYNVRNKKYHLLELANRVNDAKLPDIEIIDQNRFPLIGGVISEPIFDELSETVKRGEQAIIFLNRKGYSTTLICKQCQTVLQCDNCSVSLVYYKSRGLSNCRYCNTDYRELICKSCGSNELIDYGIGTEKVEEILDTLFPDKVLRMDMSTIRSFKELKKALTVFESNEKSILVGTQLVAKGLHFPKVTFVAILGVDNILAMPDFRSSERAYQQIIQVAGRSGRELLNGKVFIQTQDPNSPIFEFVKDMSNNFLNYELERRKETNYPPYSKLLRLIIIHTNVELARNVSEIITKEIKAKCKNITVLGPVEDAIFMVKKKYRFSILIKSNSNQALKNAVDIANQIFKKSKKGAMILKIDKDPYRL